VNAADVTDQRDGDVGRVEPGSDGPNLGHRGGIGADMKPQEPAGADLRHQSVIGGVVQPQEPAGADLRHQSVIGGVVQPQELPAPTYATRA